MGVGGSAAAGGVLAAELCAPLLLLCWLCCWPDASSDSSSTGHPRKPIIASESGRRAGGLRGRGAGSAVSLHLPGPSGDSPARSTGSAALSSHRSHEELSRSAPGVLREVLHRRDWDRSARDLYIPLHPDPEALAPAPAPRASPDTPPTDEDTPRCKKHHSNIKSSRGKEQRAVPSERDHESPSRFYIGDDGDTNRVKEKPPPPEKEEKQCLNESIRSKDRPWRLPGAPAPTPDDLTLDGLTAMNELAAPDELAALDRSGAVHHTLDSHAAMGSTRVATLSPISVDVVGYEYLTDDSSSLCGERRDRCAELPAAAPAAARARHASDGDILAPAPRPESGAFSESDLDLELRLALQAEEQARAGEGRGPWGEGRPARTDVRETAI